MSAEQAADSLYTVQFAVEGGSSGMAETAPERCVMGTHATVAKRHAITIAESSPEMAMSVED